MTCNLPVNLSLCLVEPSEQVGHFERHLDCCEECRLVRECSFFTFDYTSGVCYLKSGRGVESAKGGLISGMGVVS